jgi:hypothetical protein
MRISVRRHSTPINREQGAKISTAEQDEKFPASSHRRLRRVIGGPNTEAGAVSVRLHHGGPQGAKLKGMWRIFW